MALLVKSADWFVESSEKIAMFLKISHFIIGVTIVAIGTSLPELASSLAAVFKGETEVVAANAIGSNIFNILFIVGLSAVVARCLIVKRSLIDLDAPLLAITTILFIFISLDRKISISEGFFLCITFFVYLLYTIFEKRESSEEAELVEVLPSRIERREKEAKIERDTPQPEKLNWKVFLFLIIGMVGLIVGANYTIESLKIISKILKLPSSLLAVIFLATGTSLPELAVSVRAAMHKKYEISLGNIFGSNVFNVLIVVGIPAFFKPLFVDDLTYFIGLPFFSAATFLFVISGISRRIHIWEGAMYLLIYILFIVKLCGIF
jgi:cation:H+ antiporter